MKEAYFNALLFHISEVFICRKLVVLRDQKSVHAVIRAVFLQNLRLVRERLRNLQANDLDGSVCGRRIGIDHHVTDDRIRFLKGTVRAVSTDLSAFA